jgi:hypothetical protein
MHPKMNTTPSYYNLNSRVNLEQLADGHIGIVKKIKSRIIQKDALKIVEMATIIREKDPELKVSLICNDNICSKSVKLLIDNDIEVLRDPL